MLGNKHPHVPESLGTNVASLGQRFLPWWGSSKVIQSAPAEANQANQEASRNSGCVRFVVSTLRHFLLLFFVIFFECSLGWWVVLLLPAGEASGPLGHMESSMPFLSQTPSTNFWHTSSGKVVTAAVTAPLCAKHSSFSHWLFSAGQE